MGMHAYRSCMHFWADCRDVQHDDLKVEVVMEVDLDVWDLRTEICTTSTLGEQCSSPEAVFAKVTDCNPVCAG